MPDEPLCAFLSDTWGRARSDSSSPPLPPAQAAPGVPAVPAPLPLRSCSPPQFSPAAAARAALPISAGCDPAPVPRTPSPRSARGHRPRPPLPRGEGRPGPGGSAPRREPCPPGPIPRRAPRARPALTVAVGLLAGGGPGGLGHGSAGCARCRPCGGAGPGGGDGPTGTAGRRAQPHCGHVALPGAALRLKGAESEAELGGHAEGRSRAKPNRT